MRIVTVSRKAVVPGIRADEFLPADSRLVVEPDLVGIGAVHIHRILNGLPVCIHQDDRLVGNRSQNAVLLPVILHHTGEGAPDLLQLIPLKGKDHLKSILLRMTGLQMDIRAQLRGIRSHMGKLPLAPILPDDPGEIPLLRIGIFLPPLKNRIALFLPGVFDDFYIEPVFRKKGIARQLALAAQDWCKENGLASLTVTCAPCDERMYQSLGFEFRLGSTYTITL